MMRRAVIAIAVVALAAAARCWRITRGPVERHGRDRQGTVTGYEWGNPT
jgi:hypothetical protein